MRNMYMYNDRDGQRIASIAILLHVCMRAAMIAIKNVCILSKLILFSNKTKAEF
jgi:hypothetical protein